MQEVFFTMGETYRVRPGTTVYAHDESDRRIELSSGTELRYSSIESMHSGTRRFRLTTGDAVIVSEEELEKFDPA